jgi:hypothetical protein
VHETQAGGRRSAVAKLFWLVAASLIVTISLAGCSGASLTAPDGHRGPFGEFAGYTWFGATRAISADWSVPAVKSGALGVGATWIGVEAPGLAQNDTPFIQVGINEVRVRVSNRRRPVTAYFAFWSDTARHFRPKALLVVQPGDRIAASLVLHRRRWTVRISDLTSGTSARVGTTQETNGHFKLAQWLQEDVTDGRTNKPFQYPVLADVRFEGLAVNSSAPDPGQLNPTWMSVATGVLAPTAVSGNSFELKAASPPMAAVQYQRIAARLDPVSNTFGSRLAGFSASTSVREIGAACLPFEQALRVNIAALSHASWSASAKPKVLALIKDAHVVLSAAAMLPRLRSSDLAGAKARFLRVSQPFNLAAAQLRDVLYKPRFARRA